MNQAWQKGCEISIYREKKNESEAGETVGVCTFFLQSLWYLGEGSSGGSEGHLEGPPGWKLGTRWPPSYSRAASSALRDTPLSRAKWKQNLPPSNPAGCLLEFQWQGGWRSAGFKPQGYHPSVLTEGVQRHGLPRQPFRGGLVLFPTAWRSFALPFAPARAFSREISC